MTRGAGGVHGALVLCIQPTSSLPALQIPILIRVSPWSHWARPWDGPASGQEEEGYPGVCVRHEPPGPNSYARLKIPFSRFLPRSSVQGGLNVIRKEAWLFCKTSSGVRLYWELEEPEGPNG